MPGWEDLLSFSALGRTEKVNGLCLLIGGGGGAGGRASTQADTMFYWWDPATDYWLRAVMDTVDNKKTK